MGNKGTPKAVRKRGFLAGCARLFLVLLVLAAAGYISEVICCWQLEPTGDALFDTYARAVRDRQAWRLFHGSQSNPATLPDSVIAGWEDEFGDDPRYWQLRYWSALNHGQPLETCLYYSHTDKDLQKALIHLETGRERGSIDATGLLLLLDGAIQLRNSSLSDMELEQAIVSLPDDLAFQEQLDGLVSQSKWLCYFKALSNAANGEFRKSLDEIASGNSANDCPMPLCFPISFVFDQANSAVIPGGNELIGAILQCDVDITPFWYGALHGSIPKLTEWMGQNGTPEDFDTVHKFLCEYGSNEHSDYYRLLTALKYDRELAYTYLIRFSRELDRSQTTTILMLLDRNRRLQLEQQNSHRESEYHWALLEDFNLVDAVRNYQYTSPFDGIESVLHYPYSVFAFHHPYRWRAFYSLFSHEYGNIQNHARGELRQMSLIDLSDPCLPLNWFDINTGFFAEIHPKAYLEYGIDLPDDCINVMEEVHRF